MMMRGPAVPITEESLWEEAVSAARYVVRDTNAGALESVGGTEGVPPSDLIELAVVPSFLSNCRQAGCPTLRHEPAGGRRRPRLL